MVKFIGASLQEVKRAIKKGTIRVEINRAMKYVTATGGGTKTLTRDLLKRISMRLIREGPSSAFVIGWGDPKTGKFRLELVYPPYVSRDNMQKMNEKRAKNLMWEQISDELDGHYGTTYEHSFTSLTNYGIDWYPIVNSNNNNVDNARLATYNSKLYVWPAGIVANQRISNGTNILHTVKAKQNSLRWKALWYNPSRWQKYPDIDASERKPHNAYVIPILNAYRRKVRNAKARHANVMAELRAMPPGARHPSFPGGANYHASIKRLEAMAREEAAARNEAARRKNLKRKRSN